MLDCKLHNRRLFSRSEACKVQITTLHHPTEISQMSRFFQVFTCLACAQVLCLSGAIYAAACSGNLADCISWGPNSPEATQYNYCCRANLPMIVSCIPPSATARDNPTAAACGDLMNRTYDPALQAYFCFTLASAYSCGGNPGVNGGCQVVGCSGE